VRAYRERVGRRRRLLRVLRVARCGVTVRGKEVPRKALPASVAESRTFRGVGLLL